MDFLLEKGNKSDKTEHLKTGTYIGKNLLCNQGGSSMAAWLESLQKAINYIEDNLLEEISIEDIAKNANSSAYNFQRTFGLLTEITVGEYIRRRRLTLAADELIRTNSKIIDLAFKYGYDTPEAFTKAFRRQHEVSPSEARKNIGKIKSYNRLVIEVRLKGAEPMKYQIVEREGFQAIGVKKEFSLENEGNIVGIPKMWDELNGDGTTDKLAQINNGQIKGVLGICDSKSNNSIDYWVATEYVGDVKEGFEVIEIPASKWAVFEVHGPMPDAMTNGWKQIFSEWFPSSGYEYAGTPEFEMYTDDDPFSADCYSEIWIPVK